MSDTTDHLARISELEAERDAAVATLAHTIRRIESELDHAAMNEHRLDPMCQGVVPGETVPAVRVEYIESVLTTLDVPDHALDTIRRAYRLADTWAEVFAGQTSCGAESVRRAAADLRAVLDGRA